jgi:hypothetical protein
MKNLEVITEEILNDTQIAYHITRRNNLAKIKQQGLIPKKPEDMDDEYGVYCFSDMESLENAMMNWLGERIEEWEEDNDEEYGEICLKIDIKNLKQSFNSDVGYEIVVKEIIPPNRILEILNI